MAVMRIRSVGTGVAGAPYLSTHYFGGETDQASEAVEKVADFWSALASMQVTGLSWSIGGVIDVIDPVSGDIQETVTGPTETVNASGGAAAAAWATQGLIRWRTGVYVGGRQIQGKTYLPAMLASQIVGGRPSSNVITAANNAVSALLAPGLVVAAVWSRKNGAMAEIQSGSPWTEFAVLRSRRT